ncbi:AbiH family protein [uncultured Ruminobacter sp.]|uniref:AbiH family protein n=1 Tax=uncultured Ruminobacter sp. TaxID=538947 RepID=UPI0025EDE577|nr:AbiH family protein [uncultured Ruminobacter sp.]
MNRFNILVVGNGYDIASGLNTKFADFFLPIVNSYILWKSQQIRVDKVESQINDYFTMVQSKYKSKDKRIDVSSSIADKELFFDNQFIIILLYYFYFDVYILKRIVDIKDIVESRKMRSGEVHVATYGDEYYFWLDKLQEYTKEINKDDSDIKWLDVENVVKDIVSDKIMICNEVKLLNIINNVERNKTFRTLSNSNDNKDIRLTSISLKECQDGMLQFNQLFCEYLQKEIQKSTGHNDNSNECCFLKEKYTHAISLNYTSTFKKSLINSECEDYFCYVHGRLEDKKIVVGTESFYFKEDTRDEYNLEKIPFFKFFQKVMYKTDDKYSDWLNRAEHLELTFYGFSFSQNDYDFIRELFIDDSDNQSGVSNSGQVRKHLSSVTIYCFEEKDKYKSLVNLAACLGKKHLASISKLLNFIIINTKD